MTDRMLIKGGIVLTQDPALGEIPGADVLIEDDKIVAVGHGLSADGARTIDADRRHRHPGLHRHPPPHLGDVDPDLRAGLRADHLLRVDPRQVRAALPARRRLRRQPVGLARVHQRGHHDARRLVAHHEHAGPRRRGHPRPAGLGDPVGVRLRLPQHLAPGLVVRAGLRRQRPDLDGADARRIRKQYFSSDDGRITMALATRGPNFCKPDVVRYEWELAKELGINITVHVAMDRFGYTKMQVTVLRDMDLLYPNTTYIHASHFTPEEWALVRDSGGNVSFAPQIEVQMGHGWAPAVTAARVRRSRSACRPTSPRPRRPTSSPRCTRSSARSAAAKHQEAWDANLDGLEAVARASSPRARSWRGRRIGGAEVAGIADRTGSLTPGKKADIVIIDGSAVNVAPIIDPVGAVVCAADVSNVKTVIVDGEILKEDFRLKADLDRAAEGRRGVARLPRLEVRRAGARLGRQGHRLAHRTLGRGRFPRRPRPTHRGSTPRPGVREGGRRSGRMIRRSRVRVGFIGAGGMARAPPGGRCCPATTRPSSRSASRPAAPMPRSPRCSTSAAAPAPPNEPDWQRFVETFGGELDAVVIITPHVLHHDQATACLEAGLDVLLEKPMVMNAAEATSADRDARPDRPAARRRLPGQPVAAGPRRRRGCSASGELGADPQHQTPSSGRTGRPRPTGTWRQEPALSGGGFLFDTGAHMLNTVADLAGEDFTEVAAWLENDGRRSTSAPWSWRGWRPGARDDERAAAGRSRRAIRTSACSASAAILRTGIWGERLEIQRAGAQRPARRCARSRPIPVWEQFLERPRAAGTQPEPARGRPADGAPVGRDPGVRGRGGAGRPPIARQPATARRCTTTRVTVWNEFRQERSDDAGPGDLSRTASTPRSPPASRDAGLRRPDRDARRAGARPDRGGPGRDRRPDLVGPHRPRRGRRRGRRPGPARACSRGWA